MSRMALLIAALAASVLAAGCTDPMPTFVFDAAADAPASDAHAETGGGAGSDGGTDAADDASAGDSR